MLGMAVLLVAACSSSAPDNRATPSTAGPSSTTAASAPATTPSTATNTTAADTTKLDAAGWSACSQFTDVLDQARQGLLTAEELRMEIKGVYKVAKDSTTSGIATGATAMLRADHAGNSGRSPAEPLTLQQQVYCGRPLTGLILPECASSSSGAEEHRKEEHHDVTERQAHGSQPV
jgi:hypothetical protein